MRLAIAVVGLGVMGRRMIERLGQHPGFRVAAIWDPSPEACAAAALAAPQAEIASGPDAIATRFDLSGVYIASPPASHAELCHRFFESLKPVFCEKPLTNDVAAGELLVERVHREKLTAAVNFSFASSPAFQAVQFAALDGVLGKIRRISIRCSFAKWPRDWQTAGPWLSERVEGGFTREVLSHFIFATQRITGPLTVRSARPVYPADGVMAETALTATLEGKGIEVVVDAGVRGSVDDTNEWTVHGDQCSMRIRDWREAERSDHRRVWTPVTLDRFDDQRYRAGLRQLDQLYAMLTIRPHSLAFFHEALDVQHTIEGMLRG